MTERPDMQPTRGPVLAVLSATIAAGAALGLLTITSQVGQGLAWAAAAVTAGAAAVTITCAWARVAFGAAALATGYLAVVALGPSGDEEFVYPFAALRAMPVVAILYILAFWAMLSAERSAR
ncbi:MAG: hypothetical protein EOO38_12780 [Cytophagaceae bacterium]|nr:MAG: hypothetical protein EOO38_12780 [Cytophagaceae bacterium]